MAFPSQLKKSNTCGIVKYDKKMDISGTFEKDLFSSIRQEAESSTLIDFFAQNKFLKLKDLVKLNLKKLYLDLSKKDVELINKLSKNVNFNESCNILLDEMAESELFSEFNKKEVNNDKEEYIENILSETLISVLYFLGILLLLENALFNEATFNKKIRILLNFMRIILPELVSENLRTNQLELFEEAFICCLDEINDTVRKVHISELYSTQIIITLLAIFSIEDVNSKIMLLVIDIIVQLFITNALNSESFLESTLNLILNVIEDIPQTSKSLRKARIYIDLDFSIHAYANLIIRLIQGVCIPNNISFDSNYDINKHNSIKYYNVSNFICNHFSIFFINKMILQRTKTKDYHFSNGNDIAVIILTDILKASLTPRYNICSKITQIIFIQLIKISNNSLLNENSNSKLHPLQLETYFRELCIHLLGTSFSIISKNINLDLTNKIFFEKEQIDFHVKNEQGTAEDKPVHGENLIDCVCKNASLIFENDKIIECDNCKKKFHFACISKDTYMEICERWRCDDCLIGCIYNEINEGIGTDEMEISEDHKLTIISIIILDYLYRKTALSVSSRSEHLNVGKDKIITDKDSSILCSYILEMVSKLKLNISNNSTKKDNKGTSNSLKNKKLLKKPDMNSKFHLMLLKEWFFPITRIHSPIITYSSKIPKLLESDTIRIWNKIILKEFKALPDLILHCLLSNIYNSTTISIRRTSLNSIAQIISVRPNLLLKQTILNAIILSLRDKTPKIRERALVIIERYFSDINLSRISKDQDLDRETNLFLEQVLRTTYDVSPLVRMASVRILKIFYINDPSKLNIGAVLLKRAFSNDETHAIKRLILDTFILLWFHSTSEVNEEMANHLVQIINYSESKEFNQLTNSEYRNSNFLMMTIVSCLQNNQVNSSTHELITRWSSILIDMFLRMGHNINRNKTKISDLDKLIKIQDSNQKFIFTLEKLQILKAIEVIGQAYPNSIKEIFSHIVVYLKDFGNIDSEIIIHICKIISYMIPFVRDPEMENIEFDLLKITTTSRSPQLIRLSILCLCKLLDQQERKYINNNTILTPIILDGMRTLWEYRIKLKSVENKLEIKELDLIRRNAWLLGCIYEFDSPNLLITVLNNRIERVKAIETEFGISWILWEDKNNLTKNEFNEDLNTEYNVIESSNMIFDLLCDLFYLLDWNLNKGILFPTIIQFLMNQKQFIKTVKFNTLIKSAITGINNQNKDVKVISDENTTDTEKSVLCIICLQGILSLLKNYEFKAAEENKLSYCFEDTSKKSFNVMEEQQLNHSGEGLLKDDEFNNKNEFSTPNNRKNKLVKHFDKGESNSPVSSSVFSNIDNISLLRTNIFHSASQNTTSASASQPLAANLDIIISLLQQTTTNKENRFTNLQKQQVSSLVVCILEQFNRQGLVNPTSIIPPVSGLIFSINKEISFKSYQIIFCLFDKFPDLIINKYKEITIYGFIFYSSNFKNFLGVYKKNDSDPYFRSIFNNEIIEDKIQERTRSEILEITFEYYSRIYAEKFRVKKTYRESVIKGCCRQLESLLSNDEVEELLKRFKPYLSADKKVLLMLYVEFLSYIILALPYIYESELLLILYILGEICVRCSQNYSQDSDFNNFKEIIHETNEMQVYSNAILAITCTSLQLILKREYKITENHILKFNPYNSFGKEKPKYFHFENETMANVENASNFLILNRAVLYENMQFFREKLSYIWKLSQKENSNEALLNFMNDTLYSHAQITAEKIMRPTKKKQAKKRNRKRSRNKDDLDSENSSLQSWSPSSANQK